MKLKEIKKNAHKNVKTHYATYLVLCLAAVLMGSEFSSTLSLLKQDNAKSVSGLLMHSSFVKSMTFLLPEGVFGTTNGVFAHVAVSYAHLTLPTKLILCRSRWSPYH